MLSECTGFSMYASLTARCAPDPYHVLGNSASLDGPPFIFNGTESSVPNLAKIHCQARLEQRANKHECYG